MACQEKLVPCEPGATLDFCHAGASLQPRLNSAAVQAPLAPPVTARTRQAQSPAGSVAGTVHEGFAEVWVTVEPRSKSPSSLIWIS